MKNGRTIAALCAAAFACRASAHHSEAGFDADAILAFQGTVAQYRWRNPHVYIFVDAVDDNGRSVQWEIETGATPILTRSGWTPGSLTPGDRISVRAHPAREPGRRYALLLSLRKADGTLLEQRSDDMREPARASGLSGIWKPRVPTHQYERFLELGLTEEGAVAREQYLRHDMNSESNPAAMCIPYPTPASLPTLATGLYLNEIGISDDVITIRSEFFDVERTVFMDGRGHPQNGERTVQGHSIGWWDGKDLVVDTTHFSDHRSPYQTGVPSGSRKHLVERFSPKEDGTGLLVRVRLEDPEYLAEPFEATLEWDYRPDLRLFRYECDPEVSRQFAPR